MEMRRYLFRFGDCHRDPVRSYEDHEFFAEGWEDAYHQADVYFRGKNFTDPDDYYVLLDQDDPHFDDEE